MRTLNYTLCVVLTFFCFSHAKTIYLKSRPASLKKAGNAFQKVGFNTVVKNKLNVIVQGKQRDIYLATAKRVRISKCCGRVFCQGRSGSGSNRWKKITRRTEVGKRTERNGPSKKLVKIGKSKYKFPPEKATYQEAKKLCESESLSLLTFDSEEEIAKVSEYLQYIGTSSTSLFTQSLSESSLGSDVKWGTESPPGGPGECLMQMKGVFYNASCNSVGNYACEEKPLPAGVTTTIPPEGLLESLADGLLNFVGGKNIIVPSERATKSKAKNLCAEQGLELMSFDSLTQLDSVQDFLGDIGISSSMLHTSMSNLGGDGSNWLSELTAAIVPQSTPANDGDCMGFSAAGIMGLDCDMVSNFACQAPSPPNLLPPLSMSDIFNSILPASSAEPIDIGGTHYLLPSEKATFADAKKLCGSRQMDLLTIETPNESDLLSNFLSSQSLGYAPLLTSLQPITQSGGFSWNGALEAKNLEWASGEPSGKGDCTTNNKLGLSNVPCDAPQNFMCEQSKITDLKMTSSETPIATVKVQDDELPAEKPEPLEVSVITMPSHSKPGAAVTIDPIAIPHTASAIASTILLESISGAAPTIVPNTAATSSRSTTPSHSARSSNLEASPTADVTSTTISAATTTTMLISKSSAAVAAIATTTPESTKAAAAATATTSFKSVAAAPTTTTMPSSTSNAAAASTATMMPKSTSVAAAATGTMTSTSTIEAMASSTMPTSTSPSLPTSASTEAASVSRASSVSSSTSISTSTSVIATSTSTSTQTSTSADSGGKGKKDKKNDDD